MCKCKCKWVCLFLYALLKAYLKYVWLENVAIVFVVIIVVIVGTAKNDDTTRASTHKHMF